MSASTTIFAAADYTSFGGGGGLRIISIVLGLAALAAGIFTAIDANKYPDAAHQAAGMAKPAWLAGGIVGGLLGLCCCFPLGLVTPILWFAVYKKKVEAASGGGGFGGPPGGYGGPPPGYGGPPPGYGDAPGGYQPPSGGPDDAPGGYKPPSGGFDDPPPPPPPGGGFPPPPPGFGQ